MDDFKFASYNVDLILSVDSNEWYYGKKQNVNNKAKKVLITAPISEKAVKNTAFANYINDHFIWMQWHERDTAKRKKRVLYVDKDLFVD